mmetsp:Transcript_2704/g.3635  ORF Transcript_2704/g.3635 Transcript_2704/m.3635 type:complete len:447 (-) Transcript_2704:40-1380(-)
MYPDVYALADDLNTLNLDEPNVEAIRELFQRDPAAVRYQDFCQQTLLHKSLENFPARVDLAKLFIDYFPRALMTEDDRGNLPLEIFLKKVDKKPMATLQLVVESCAEALLHENNVGQFPLHLACSTSCNVDWPRDSNVIEYLVKAFPDALLHPDNRGMFPLLHACEMYPGSTPPPTKAIAVMIDQAPHILTEIIPDKYGKLPLHTLAASSWYFGTLSVLADKFPRALLLQDSEGNTPLLNACLNFRASLDMIYCLVRQWPEQVTSQSANVFNNLAFNGEMLPVAIASESATIDRVKSWAEKQPSLLLALDGFHKRLPLHYAAASRSQDAWDIVQCLVRIHPEGASVKDSMDRYPLHYAALSKSSEARKIANLFIQHYPDALTCADVDGLLPWHYAECANACFGSDVADFLYEHTSSHDPDTYIDGYIVPDEVRWDIMQVSQVGLLE